MYSLNQVLVKKKKVCLLFVFVWCCVLLYAMMTNLTMPIYQLPSLPIIHE